MTRLWRGAVIGALSMLLLLLLIGLIVVLTGGYNVAATDRHNPIVGWALSTTMENWVQDAADEVEAPARFTPEMVAAGAGEYKAMCEHCHGGVGVGRAGWASGMLPHPPALATEAGEWTGREVFWIVRHGIKMTGMPAFGPTHDDQTIWNIAAFVDHLPQMSAEEYAAYPAGHGGAGHSHAGSAAAPASGSTEGAGSIEAASDTQAGHAHPEGTAPHQD